MVPNVGVKESDVRDLDAALRAAQAAAPVVQNQQAPYVHYLIRFDERGNRVFSLIENSVTHDITTT